MILYSKKVDDKMKIFGTLANQPSENDVEATYKDADGIALEIIPNDTYLDDGKGGIKRLSDGKEVEVYLGSMKVIPSEIVTAKDVQELVAALSEGGFITISADLTIENQLDASKDTVLDFGDHVITNTKDIWNISDKKWSLLSVKGDSNVVIRGGRFIAKPDDEYAVDIRDGGNLLIENGEFNGNITSVYVYEGTLTINGGEFRIQQLDSEKGYQFLLNCYDANYKNGTAKIIVKGGKFYGFNPAANAAESEDMSTNFVAEGYKVIQNGDCYEVVKDEEVIAE